ncbi:MAG TPA: type II CAAX endopeptidase family protein [Acidimicrobiales bacterium]|nr:type II CAAX endopeptidase family protein [Acidimicrobiales bacterium]
MGASFTLVIVLAVSGYADTPDDLPLGWFAVAQLGLWVGLLGAPIWAATRRGNGVVADLGFSFEARDVPIGLGIGVVSQFILLPLIYAPIFWLTDIDSDELSEAAEDLTDRAVGPLSVVLLVLIVGFGAPIVEEIFYRGMVQRALGRWAGPVVAVGGSALWFAASHFQPLQFAGLLAFGLVLGWLAHRTGRLGTAIFAHIGFNLTTVIVLLAS